MSFNRTILNSFSVFNVTRTPRAIAASRRKGVSKNVNYLAGATSRTMLLLRRTVTSSFVSNSATTSPSTLNNVAGALIGGLHLDG